MANLPTGTVTFLFTDIEGSMELAQQYPTAMPALLARHHALVRQAIESHHGHVFQVAGDAFCSAFDTAPDALCAALDAQRALHCETWFPAPIKVRMGIHTGVAQVQAIDAVEGGYSGYSALAQVQRVMSTAHGGQILVSNTTAELLRRQLPAGITLHDCGEHRLKGILTPERLWQVVAPDLPQDFPPLATLATAPNNLPIQTTSFVGREQEIAHVQALLAETRLVTLMGAGGCGKTRLASEAAARVLDRERFPNGVWWIELAPLADPALIIQTIATVLGLREEPARSVRDTVLAYTRDKRLLLVLDNCEHLIEACAQLADTLMHTCPQLRILATSREALGIAGEAPYRIPSLSMPPQNGDIETLTLSESARLFIDRAATLVPSFAVTNQNVRAVAQICQRLDGIPLALELAAARVKVLSVEQIAKRLDDRFKLLTGGSRTALPRQQTLRALIDWSHNLLSDPERVFLRRLSVFSGGWTLEAAQSVCGFDPVGQDEVLDLLERLVDKSLVLVDCQRDAARYRLMETIRQYAQDKLLESDEGAEIRTRHLDFFLQLAQEAEPKLRGREQHAWLERLDWEHDNLRTALEWSTNEGCVERGMRLVSALLWFWDMRSYWKEGRDCAENLLMQPEALTRTLARTNTLFAAAILLGHCGERKLQEQRVRESISIARELGDVGKRTLALSLGLAGDAVFGNDLAASQAMIEESLAIARSLRDPWHLAFLLLRAGSFSVGKLDHVEARERLEKSFDLFQSLGDKRRAATVSDFFVREAVRQRDFAGARLRAGKLLRFFRQEKDRMMIASTLNVLGVIEHADGNHDLARVYYAEALEIRRELGSGIFSPAKNLGCILLYKGDLDRAKALFAECMDVARASDNRAQLGYAIQSYAGIAAVEKQPHRAIVLLAATQKLQDEAADKSILSPAGDYDFTRSLAIARERVDEATFNAAWAKGCEMTMEQAIAYALEAAYSHMRGVGQAQIDQLEKDHPCPPD